MKSEDAGRECPECDEGMYKDTILSSYYTGVPAPQRVWRCPKCGGTWIPSGSSGTETEDEELQRMLKETDG